MKGFIEVEAHYQRREEEVAANRNPAGVGTEYDSRELFVETPDGAQISVQSEFPMRFSTQRGGSLLIEERRWKSKRWHFLRIFAAGQWSGVKVFGSDRFAYFAK